MCVFCVCVLCEDTLLSADTQKGYSDSGVDLLTAQLVVALFGFSHRDGMLDQEHHAPTLVF